MGWGNDLPKNDDIYFANLDGREFLDALKNKVNVYRNFIARSGHVTLWQTSLGAFYGSSEDGKQSWRVTPGGEFGELVQTKVNDYASLLRHQLVLAVAERPAGIAKAINTDIKTLRDARIGTQLVEYYLSDPAHAFEKDYVNALALALCTAEAFVIQDWNTSLGEEVRPDEMGQMLKQGDLEQQVCSTWNAARDIGAPNAEQPWYIFSSRINKFELAAKYPAYEDEIINFGSSNSGIIRSPLFAPMTEETDFIEIHKLVHLPTDACPKGRYSIFIPDEVLLDVPYPYPTNCVHRVSDRELIETAFGHTSNYDLLSLEQVTDSLHSIVLNNQTTFGVSTIVGPKGGGIAHQELAKGLRYLELDPLMVDKVKVLNLTATPMEVFNYITMLGSKKGELSGINSILRGDPDGSLKGASGSAMALLQSQAISFNSGIQKSFYRLLSSGGTGIIEILRKFADEPRVIKIAGKSNQQAIKEFKVDKQVLNSVSTVVFEPINPVLQTAAGKAQLAEMMVDKGMIKSPKRLVEVYTTGNLNVLLEDDVACEEAIIEENEQLAEGEMVEAVITEMHQDHIRGHQAVISRPNAKQDPALVQRVLIHIQQHINLWNQASQTNPALLAATGQQVLPQMPPPGMAQPGIAPPPNSGQPPESSNASAPTSSVGAGNEPTKPKLPQPPKDPMTGERAPVAAGTSIQ